MGKRWTDEELQFLKFAYPNKEFTNKEIYIYAKNSKKTRLYYLTDSRSRDKFVLR